MQKLTLKSCIQHAIDLEIPIYGDVDWRGECKVEDGELSTFHNWVIFNYPKYAPVCFHPANEWKPNNSTTSYAHYNKMINKGYKPRLADWICLGANGMPPFLCEMKREDISYSIKSRERKKHFIEQCDLLHSQKGLGHVVCIALGAKAAKQAFVDYLEKYA